MSSILSCKLYLFTHEFKQYQNIIYLDADTMVRASLDELTKVKGFAAVNDANYKKIKDQIINATEAKKRSFDIVQFTNLRHQIENSYSFAESSFCAGVFTFNTRIIKQDTFFEINKILKKYYNISAHGDQLALNLFFYKNWQELSPIYNIYLLGEKNQWFLKPNNIRGKVLHFITPVKPWIARNYFYQEWQQNLEKANKINLSNITFGKKWSKRKIWSYTIYLKSRFYILNSIDRIIGHLGISLNRRWPRFYQIIKN